MGGAIVGATEGGGTGAAGTSAGAVASGIGGAGVAGASTGGVGGVGASCAVASPGTTMANATAYFIICDWTLIPVLHQVCAKQ